jgi:hypothetical protein
MLQNGPTDRVVGPSEVQKLNHRGTEDHREDELLA